LIQTLSFPYYESALLYAEKFIFQDLSNSKLGFNLITFKAAVSYIRSDQLTLNALEAAKSLPSNGTKDNNNGSGMFSVTPPMRLGSLEEHPLSSPNFSAAKAASGRGADLVAHSRPRPMSLPAIHQPPPPTTNTSAAAPSSALSASQHARTISDIGRTIQRGDLIFAASSAPALSVPAASYRRPPKVITVSDDVERPPILPMAPLEATPPAGDDGFLGYLKTLGSNPQ